MKHKIALVSLAFVGFVLLFSGNAWAGRDHRPGHHVERRPHYGYYAKKHHGWHHHRGLHFKRFHHGPRHRGWHRGWHRRPVHRTVEKHVYHHYDSGDYGYDRYQAHGRVSEPGFSFSFGISGTR